MVSVKLTAIYTAVSIPCLELTIVRKHRTSAGCALGLSKRKVRPLSLNASDASRRWRAARRFN